MSLQDAVATINFATTGEDRLIQIIRTPATSDEIMEMLQTPGVYIKLAVDVNREILAGGGAMHADCESALLDDESAQEDIWGADWYPASQEVTYESLINIRPTQGNRSLEVQSAILKLRIERIVRNLLENSSHA
jgi:hypothetical protein